VDQDTELFVQAFWVKCRETIRPEIDAAIDDLRRAGHDASVATQELARVPDTLPAPTGPSVTLTIQPLGWPEDAIHPAIEFHADVARQAVDVRAGHGHTQSYELAALGTTEVKTEIDEWLARLAVSAPV
jgi:hypothetical protein